MESSAVRWFIALPTEHGEHSSLLYAHFERGVQSVQEALSKRGFSKLVVQRGRSDVDPSKRCGENA